MKARLPAITRKAQVQLLRLLVWVVEVPLIIASRTTWWLEGIRTRLRTALALAELEGRL